jgi:hypothetical protein
MSAWGWEMWFLVQDLISMENDSSLSESMLGEYLVDGLSSLLFSYAPEA